jgi:hypothetical protein
MMKQARCGVLLSPIKLRIFDLIVTRPGITTRSLATILFPHNIEHAALDNVRSHVRQINMALAESSFFIKGKSGHGFRLMFKGQLSSEDVSHETSRSV